MFFCSRHRSFLAMAAFGLSVAALPAAWAEPPPPPAASLSQGSPAPQKTESAGFTYAIGLGENKNGWHLVYGPMHAAGVKTAIFASKADNGALLLSCRSDGMVEMMLNVAGLYSPVGADIKATISAGTITHPLTLHAVRNEPKARETQYYQSGDNVLGMIRAIASIEAPHQAPGAIIVESGRYSLKLPSPFPAKNATMMYRLCAAWSDQHIANVTGKPVTTSEGITFSPLVERDAKSPTP